MPERCIALLRGVNLGGNKRVPMAELRRLVEALGFTEVRTLLNSGNVVFSARADRVRGAASRIAKAIGAELGVETTVTVLTAAELRSIIDENPLAAIADNPSRMLVAVFADPAARAKADALAERSWGPETIAVGARAAYLWCANGIGAGELAGAVDRALRTGVTARNIATLEKLSALAGGG